MHTNNSRRELFSSLASLGREKKEIKKVVVRPPYFENKDDFYKECASCDGVCASFCQEHIILFGDDKTPYLDFTVSGCTYCDECAKACPKGVLKLDSKKKVDVKFTIDILKCISWNQTMCFSCKDPCLENAIKFLGMFRPEINSQLCTNCGFCVKVCPTNAIIVGGD